MNKYFKENLVVFKLNVFGRNIQNRMNYQYGSVTTEREWLLKRHQRFEVLEFDDTSGYDEEYGYEYRGTVTIRLIVD